jgi:hypothetical protein
MFAISADTGCHVVSAMDPYDRILGFLDRSCYFFFQVVPQLYSRAEWTSFQIPDLWICSQELDHWTTEAVNM